MATNTHLFTTGYISGQIKQSHEDTLKLLKSLGLKPMREVRTEKRTMRQWHKDAMYAVMAHVEEKRKEKETAEPVQAILPLEALEDAVDVAKETADKMRVIPDTRIDLGTALEESRARSEEMISILRSIDARLHDLVTLWSK